MKNILYLIFLVAFASCNAQKNVSEVNVIPAQKPLQQDGIFYHLPVTVVNIEVTAKRTIEKRGPYYRYSQRFLNLNDIITEDRTSWEITEASIYTSGAPDADRVFRIMSEGTPSGAAVNLTPDGILTGLNLNETSTGTVHQNLQIETTKQPEDISFDDVPFTEEQLIKTSSAATAEEVAAEIYRLREARRRLLESDMQTLPPDNGAYERILEGINKLEEQYLSLFKGKKETTFVTKTFTFIPDASMPAEQVLFRFSEQKGFTDNLDMAGTPVYIEIKSETGVEKGRLQPREDKTERSGLIYCKPAKVNVKVIDRTVLLNEAEVLVAQFGTLHRLPSSLLDSSVTKVKLDQKTGALLKITTK
ncbi:DUF4831 family protein [Anaerophaga thermohalophila]|uniref:DUF4831 family protein n=1 Tax=Anaerophaga thermohalophila TaxID=177400 RepID=UPI000237CA46|nr:DUF4831 family protein [Anaerophaga thermohalophila]